MIRRALPWAAVVVIGGAAGIALTVRGADHGEGDADADAGRVLFVRSTAGAGARLVTGSTPQDREFMRENYWRMRGHAPFFDRALRWAPPSHVYQDLYALYPTEARDRALVREHPEWVLRDERGRKLFIPFDCDGRRCAAWAADPGNPEWRAHWLARARAEIETGYVGVFIDNVNMELRVGDADAELVVPVDPRTEARMDLTDWRRYVAEFTEEIRTALAASEIVHNSIWFADRADPYVQRQLSSADFVELERGFADPGIEGGGGEFGFETFLAHIERLHELGPAVILEPHGIDEAGRYYELAAYFLVNDGEDAIASRLGANPGNWWPGWEADLGKPLNDRYLWEGLWRRDFAAGLVLVNPPGGETRTATLDAGLENLDGRSVTRVRLVERNGIVLRTSNPPRRPG